LSAHAERQDGRQSAMGIVRTTIAELRQSGGSKTITPVRKAPRIASRVTAPSEPATVPD
jgi:hypothetical protein